MDVESALQELGCPQWMKPPKKGHGFAAVRFPGAREVARGELRGRFREFVVTVYGMELYMEARFW